MGRTKRESTAATLALSGRLGDLVDQWKYDNKKTQEELAKEIGVRASSLSDWINDSSTPTIDQLYKVAKFFDVPADYLIGLSNVQTLNTNLQATEKSVPTTSSFSQSIMPIDIPSSRSPVNLYRVRLKASIFAHLR